MPPQENDGCLEIMRQRIFDLRTEIEEIKRNIPIDLSGQIQRLDAEVSKLTSLVSIFSRSSEEIKQFYADRTDRVLDDSNKKVCPAHTEMVADVKTIIGKVNILMTLVTIMITAIVGAAITMHSANLSKKESASVSQNHVLSLSQVVRGAVKREY